MNISKSETKIKRTQNKPVERSPKQAEAPKAQAPKKQGSGDKVTVSKESTRSEQKKDSGFSSFLDSFQNGFSELTEQKNESKEAGDKKNPLTELKGERLKEQLDKLPAEQKEKKALDSLKGLQGKELESRLSEIEKVDKELAEKLREKLGLNKEEDAAKAGESKEAKPAEKAKKAGGGNDGAPSESFLWKPVSESNGKLVILLPSSLTARSVTISGPNVNETVNKGGGNGKRANGQREHFRFGKSGEQMQGPVQVTVTLESGQTKTMNIANPAKRNEGGKLKDSAGGGRAGMFGAKM